MKTPDTTFYFSKIDRTSSAKMAAASFLSGFAALTYQVIWQKCLTQEVGLDSISTSLILSVFLLGLAFGYLFGSLIADSLKHLTPGVFVCVEVATGIFGLFSISYLRWANNLLLYDYPLVLEFLLNFLVLVIPTFLMGMSTPLLFSSIKEKLENFGKTLGIFYGANLLGAAIGTLGAGFFLIELIGLKLSSAVGASANFLSGFIAFNAFYRHPSNLFYSRKFPSVSQILKGLGKRASFQISWRWQIVVSILLFGFVSIGFEMVAFRILTNQFTQLSYIFPMILFVFLLNMALGQALVGFAVDRMTSEKYQEIFLGLMILTGITIAVSFNLPIGLAGPNLTLWQEDIFNFHQLFFFSFLFLIPIIFIGGFFPAICRHVIGKIEDMGKVTGQVLFLFTFANGISSLLTPFVLFAWLGSIATVKVLFCLTVLGVLLLFPTKKAFVSALLSLGFLVLISDDYFYHLKDPDLKKNYFSIREDHTGILSLGAVGENPKTSNVIMRINRTATSSATKTITPQTVARHNFFDSMLVAPNWRPKKVLVIGLGDSIFLYGLTRFDFIESITVVELFPNILNSTHEFSHPKIKKAMEDRRVNLIVGDGRRYVKKILKAGREKFDLIQIGVFLPHIAGASNVYTKDFFQIIDKVLSYDGFVTIALPHPMAIEAAMSVFPNGYGVSGGEFGRYRYFSRAAYAPRGEKVFHSEKMCGQAQVNSMDIQITTYQQDGEPERVNTDDNPIIEYYLVRKFFLPFFLNLNTKKADRAKHFASHRPLASDSLSLICGRG